VLDDPAVVTERPLDRQVRERRDRLDGRLLVERAAGPVEFALGRVEGVARDQGPLVGK
jgi:hypothetical protein